MIPWRESTQVFLSSLNVGHCGSHWQEHSWEARGWGEMVNDADRQHNEKKIEGNPKSDMRCTYGLDVNSKLWHFCSLKCIKFQQNCSQFASFWKIELLCRIVLHVSWYSFVHSETSLHNFRSILEKVHLFIKLSQSIQTSRNSTIS